MADGKQTVTLRGVVVEVLGGVYDPPGCRLVAPKGLSATMVITTKPKQPIEREVVEDVTGALAGMDAKLEAKVEGIIDRGAAKISKMVDEGDRMRALSDKLEDATWPPEVGDRIHYNCGHFRGSWTGEVRAIVDDQYAVIRKCAPDGDRERYDLESYVSFEAHFSSSGKRGKARTMFRKGPIPKGLKRDPNDY